MAHLGGGNGLLLNVAHLVSATLALGPGLRAALWLQGCPFHCPGCISPEWIPQQPNRLVAPADLLDELLVHPDIDGLTFSGGEPMLQAAGLAELIRLAHIRRPSLTVICFTGYMLEDLQSERYNLPAVHELLAWVDVLIDGPYIAIQDNNRGLRGSFNQHIHYLSERLAGYDLENGPRRAEIRIINGQVLLVGVPPKGVLHSFQQAIDRAIRLKQ